MLSALVLSCTVAFAEVRYTVTDLGNLGQRFAQPSAVSDSGYVAGQAFTASGQSQAFLWSAGTNMINLIPPGEPGLLPEGVAYGVNDAGQAVGYVRPDQDADKLAFVWSASTGLQTIGTLGGPESDATAINNAGQVTGISVTATGALRAYRWSASTGMQDLGTIGGASAGNAINDLGHVAGFAVVNGQKRAFRWRPDTGMTDIGTLGGILAEGHGINIHDQIVGESATAEGNGNLYSHAFKWDPQTGMQDLGTLGGNTSQAWGVNDAGWVVGYSYLASNEPPVKAFVHDGITMHKLNDLIDPASGWDIRDAYDINNAGQIVGIAVRVNEPWGHGVLLTPIPEPGGVVACALGTVSLGRHRRLSRQRQA